MNQLCFTFLLTFICITAQAQEASLSTSATKKNRFSFGLAGSFDYGYRMLTSTDDSNSSGTVKRLRNDREISSTGYTAGLGIRLDPGNQIGFELGAQYSIKSYKTKKQDLFWPNPGPADPTHFQNIYEYQYVEFPVKLLISLNQKKRNIAVGMGIIPQWSLRNNQIFIAEFSSGEKERMRGPIEEHEYRTFNLAPVISLSFTQPLSNSLIFNIEPEFKIQLLNNTNTPVTERLWSAGIRLGLYQNL
jgi:hypothetical protein